MRAIVNATVLTPMVEISDGVVLVDGDKIVAVGSAESLSVPPSARLFDAAGRTLVPGFIDLQFNGGFGHDFTHDPTTIWSVSAEMVRWGVTSFLPTVITSPLATMAHAQQVLQAGPPVGWRGAQPLGLHLEGPFLNPQKKGAHNPNHIQLPSLSAVADWTPDNGVALVTLAPEMEGALPVIEALAERGVVVSAGHSMATLAEAKDGISAGIRYATHLFNAMRPLHHREPGLATAVLMDDRVTLGIIPDGIHVHPDLVAMSWALTRPSRLNVVTDAMAAVGMPPGRYQLGTFDVEVNTERAQLADGTLAGSIVTMDSAVGHFQRFTHCSLAEAVATATTTPARLLNLRDRKGAVAPGLDADLVLLNDDLSVSMTMVAGEIVYTR